MMLCLTYQQSALFMLFVMILKLVGAASTDSTLMMESAAQPTSYRSSESLTREIHTIMNFNC